MTREVERTEEQWRELLTLPQYAVLRQGGTERPFTGRYWDHFAPGEYRCAGCGAALFDADAKYATSCGWPSFTRALDPARVEERPDLPHGLWRVEVLCRSCGGHLGHVFPDGPEPTGLRYCINSASLVFHAR